MLANTTGGFNSAFGRQTLASNTTGTYNSAFGMGALNTLTTGSFNTACGEGALQLQTTASSNVAVGYQAGYTNTTGQYNTFVGTSAGNLATGGNNQFIGNGAGRSVTTGGGNSIIGNYSGNQGGLDIRTSNNYIVLSDGDGNPRAWIGAGNDNDLFRVGTTSTGTSSFMHAIQYSQTSRYVINFANTTSANNPSGVIIDYPNSGSTTSSDNLLYCGISSGARATIRNNGGLANFQANNVNISDRREKDNFAPAKSYLNVICAIPVQTFNYIDQDLEDDPGLTLGVVAQDVQEVAPELVMESNWGTSDNPKMRLSIYQTDLQYALMKCIQEQQAIIESLTARVSALEGK